MIYNKIWINGLQILGDDCPYYSNLYNFLLDSTNTNNDSELYYDGSYAGSSKINSKTFTLVVDTKDSNDIKGALQITYILAKGEIPLVVDVEGLGLVECNVKKESIITDEFGIMTATLKMCDPYIYSKNYKEIILEKQIEGGWKFPTNSFTIPNEWNYNEKTIGNVGEIVNESYATIYPLIEIVGEAREFKIINETTGEKLNIDVNLESGQTLYIDCKPNSRCIKVNGISFIKYKSGNYISLSHGSNQIKIDYEGECVVYIKWREAWI